MTFGQNYTYQVARWHL